MSNSTPSTTAPEARALQVPFEKRVAIPIGVKLKLIGLGIKAVLSAMDNEVKCAVNVNNHLDEPLGVRWPALVHGKPSPGRAGEFQQIPLPPHTKENVGCENVDSGLYGPRGFVLLTDANDSMECVGLVTFEVPYGQSFPTFFNCYCNAVWVSRSEPRMKAYLHDPSNDNITRVMDHFYREYQSREVNWGKLHLSAHIGNSFESVLSIHIWST